jgi:predicted ABC-type ATPase
LKERVRHRQSFAFETTLSGRTYARLIREWQELGYHVKLIFLSLPNSDMAVARVAARVAREATTCRRTLSAAGSVWVCKI